LYVYIFIETYDGQINSINMGHREKYRTNYFM